MGPLEEIVHLRLCRFCGLGGATRGYGWRRALDYSGLPPAISLAIRLALSDSPQGQYLLACDVCAPLVKSNQYAEMDDNVRERYAPLLEGYPVQIRAILPKVAWSAFFRAFMWAANRTDLGEEIDIMKALPAGPQTWAVLAQRTIFDSETCWMALGGARALTWGTANTLGFEQISTRERRKGHGSRLVRLICDAADDCAATIIGKVEPFDDYDFAPSLSSDELFKWYARYGFSRSAGTDVITRKPSSSRISIGGSTG